MGRVFDIVPVDQDSIPDRITPKTQKMVLDVSLLNTIRYRSRVSGVIQEMELHPPLHIGVVAIEKKAFGWPLSTVGQHSKMPRAHFPPILPVKFFSSVNPLPPALSPTLYINDWPLC